MTQIPRKEGGSIYSYVYSRIGENCIVPVGAKWFAYEDISD